MGKKVKTGKARRDKFYHLAKETGYRSRAAFKLLQLNRKYQFLQSSRVVIDLCAAPGGWLQVAANQTPVSSHVIGVDLVPIRAVPNCITLTEDITTDKCRQALKKELQTWKADCVLNDGAPNLGKNWVHDAFAQAELTLQALRLGTDFLKKGGWFVTKVFRSKDYNALMWVFKQFFRKVFATKPQASRNESAEVFVVCQHYFAPDKIDPKLLDPKFVFKEVDTGPTNEINMIHPEKKNKKVEGYADGDYTCFHTLPVSKFLQAENHVELLSTASAIDIDLKTVLSHVSTTTEIKECCKDIKVLGKKEIRTLLNWRKKLVKEFAEKLKLDEGEIEETKEENEDQVDEDEQINQKLAEMKASEQHEQKKKLKKVRKEKAKLRQKMDLKMVIPGDKHDFQDDISLFKLGKIKSKEGLSVVEKGDIDFMDDDGDESDDDMTSNRKLRQAYDRGATQDYSDESESEHDDSEDEEAELEMEEYNEEGEEEEESDNDDEKDEQEEPDSNPLMLDLEEKSNKSQRQAALWFKKDIFSGIEGDRDEDLEVEKMAEEYKKKGGVILGKSSTNLDKKEHKAKKNKRSDDRQNSDGESDVGDAISDSEDESGIDNEFQLKSIDDDISDDSEDDDDDSDYDINENLDSKETTSLKRGNTAGFEVVPAETQAAKIRKLDPEGLAIGAAMVQSQKRRRDIIEGAYNRFTNNDEHLPDWFVQDERKHMKKRLPVTKEEVAEYKERLKAVNARPMKKIAEAKGRKKRKMVKRIEKARKKADVVSETVDVTDREKWQQIKQIYKRAGLLKNKKEEVQYVVAKRGMGKRVSRPAGVKGRFKVVDPRMRKDDRQHKVNVKNQKKGGRQAKSRKKK
ncbi:pre-rRNA 2'-O-ribose RNA methyltransferase FTSJ3-like [Tubulanus polymorphus]|uniref:pre-rRNA 2'-O-ribose RNA methyltransferase FTSJ3-like n=1 Tax=Tubulanus polymorphus TaxID=672921 RepID=UPI003DA34BA8